MSMMRRLGAVVLLLAIVCAGCGGKPPRRHHESAGGFSYDPPESWQIVEFPGLKYRIAHGPARSGFAPNINVVDEAYSGSLTAYVEANLKNMKTAFATLTILKREGFRTEDGDAAVRLITETKQQGRRLRQTFHFFGRGKRKYVATCTALAEGGEELDEPFEKSMKTFRIH